MQIAHNLPSPSEDFENFLSATGQVPRAAINIRLKDFSLTRGMRSRIVTAERDECIFLQGEDAGAAFYLQEGEVKLTVLSRGGREATIA